MMLSAQLQGHIKDIWHNTVSEILSTRDKVRFRLWSTKFLHTARDSVLAS